MMKKCLWPALFVAALASPVAAAEYIAPPLPAVGTNTMADIELLVPRPATEPCIVELFPKREFVGDQPVPFDYAPPKNCKGPWAKVVIEADYAVSAGRQFDRTAIIDIGGVNVYFGTTMEPRKDIAPEWHVERDITDYQAHLLQKHKGATLLVNYVDDTYTGHLTGKARILFYPASKDVAIATTAPFVKPLSDAPVRLDSDNPKLVSSVRFPANLEKLYLDLLAEPQGADEFWYACVEDRFAGDGKGNCGGGAWREVDVWIDGARAGTAPLYPWIYTGGINPYMWFPTPGIQTLNFEPTRLDLTPFAGLLTDGKPHEIAVTIHGLRKYFLVTGTLMGWQDAGAKRVTGAVISNTLGEPTVTVDSQRLRPGADGDLNGDSLTNQSRTYEIAGYVDTSHGRVETRVRSGVRFMNRQDFVSSAEGDIWRVDQVTLIDNQTQTIDQRGSTVSQFQARYPLTIDMKVNGDETNRTQNLRLAQGLWSYKSSTDPSGQRRWQETNYVVQPSLRAELDPKSRRSRKVEGSSFIRLHIKDSEDGCYDRMINIKDNSVASASDNCP
ncbi:peptide-N4-asparagine amidase [Niveispirillum irakense]|uniref:peptide-N4-asparagine amidase n=1 Tax=Niveispirillum irakense TaxID=34011 RepID=UPI000A01A0CF|nr:peptide-N4-asparagine amidase [Niveispirillum irakense]